VAIWATGQSSFDAVVCTAETIRQVSSAAAIALYGSNPLNSQNLASTLAAADNVYLSTVVAAGLTYGVMTYNELYALTGQAPPT